MKLIFLNSHPIQYFAPLYRQLSGVKGFELEVWYCTEHGLGGELDREFETSVKWDVPVLEGYQARFLKNHSPKPGIYGFFGLMNLGLIPLLFANEKKMLVVHGWGYFSNLLALLIGRMSGQLVCLRGETPACHEGHRTGWKKWLRTFFVRNILGSLSHRILFIGEENRKFYQRYGIPEHKLVFAPYAVDNHRFQQQAAELKPDQKRLRNQLQLPADKVIILFSGKYIQKKRPLDLLAAFSHCRHRDDAHLVFMGEGELRSEMEAFIKRNDLQNVTLTGFVNQSEVAKYYASADIFVMCSGLGETWGLSTNEAMNFGLPVILSDLTGSHADLVAEGENGFVFKTGDVEALSEKLDAVISLNPEERQRMGKRSLEIINGYSFDQIVEGLKAAAGLDKVAAKMSLSNRS